MADPKKLKPEELEREPELARSYAGWFAVLGLAFLASFLWSVWDETIARRPWKRYQAEFQSLEQHLLSGALAEVREELGQPDQRGHLEEIAAAHRQAVEAYENDPQVKQLREELRAMEPELYRVQRDFQQARSRLQEAEYWKEKTAADWADKKVASLTPPVEEFRVKYDDLTEKKADLQTQLDELAAENREFLETLNALKKPELDLLRRLEAARARPVEIKQIYIPELDVVDRCESCHTGVRDPLFADAVQPFTSHPSVFSLWREDPSGFSWKGILDVHPPERFGCTTCHRGQGYATTSPDKAHGYSVDEAGDVHYIEHWPTPMLRGEFVQASCLKCHQDLEHLPGAELLAHGQRLFDRYACHNCHIAKGYEDSRKVAPSLAIVGSKVNRQWLVQWLKKPKDYLPNTVMPDFLLSDDEVEHIADFLMTLRGEEEPLQPIEWPDWAETSFDDLGDDEFDQVDAMMVKGQGVFGEAQCSICHSTVGASGGAVGGATGLCPDLVRITTKVNRNWLYRWIQHPKALNANTQMPHFRFTDEELRALVEFIVRDDAFRLRDEEDFDDEASFDGQQGTEDEGVVDGEEDIYLRALKTSLSPPPADQASIAEGRRLIDYYQCNGCHSIPGFDEKLRLCVELSFHGSKPIEELDFGRKEDKIPHTRQAWFTEKLRDPRGFRDGLKMPDFGFSERDLKAIAILLTGNVREMVPEDHRVPAPKHPYIPPGEFGSIVADVNCFACHRINGRGGTYAPDLTGEGSKVRRGWLKRFFKHPDVLRPLLKQMPHFHLTDEQVETLTEHVKVALVDPRIPHNFLPEDPTPEEVAQGKQLYDEKGCYACHQIGAEGGAVGPVLGDAGDRLENGYIFAYLRNPGAFRPEAPEPNYALTEGEAIFLTKFLSTLKESPSPTEPGEDEPLGESPAEGESGEQSSEDAPTAEEQEARGDVL